METIGVGLIGTGYMGKCHALAWMGVRAVFGDAPAIRRVALCEVEESLARRRADEFGFKTATADWKALVSNPRGRRRLDHRANRAPCADGHRRARGGQTCLVREADGASFAEAERMAEVARASGKVAILGYDYIQCPAIRYIAKRLGKGAIGRITNFRVEMDEDFMADPEAPFSWRSDASSGYGALNDFAVHPMSFISTLLGMPREVFGEMSKPYADRPDGSRRREVENFDNAIALLRMDRGAFGAIQVSRCAWGRKGRIQIQIFGDRGAIVFDQERFNEVGVYLADGPAEDQGIKTVLIGPAHPPYEKFVPAAGHQLGFNELKIVEAHELLNRIAGKPSLTIDFDQGLAIERTIHAIARSSQEGRSVAAA